MQSLLISSYVENLYHQFLTDPSIVSEDWRKYFEKFHSLERSGTTKIDSAVFLDQKKQASVFDLIEAYRSFGHLNAKTNPLQEEAERDIPQLGLNFHDLSVDDLDKNFERGSFLSKKNSSLAELLMDLNKVYCGSVSFEYQYIFDPAERLWIQQKIEQIPDRSHLSADLKVDFLQCLLRAKGFEKYIGLKYPGAKRFSLEGSDSLMIALDTLIKQAAFKGFQEVVFSMAHRGRLNVLVNLLGKNPGQLFDEFEGKIIDAATVVGDVKYHQGFSSNIQTSQGVMHLSLSFNPSHLEIVNPVSSGSVRARQDRRADSDYSQVLAIAVHGDAAFSGQGVVMESFNLSQTRGFKVGGTIHLIVNNQIGFTTSNPDDARSTLYCTDIGKMMAIPVIHVNANDPEAVYQVMCFAIDYRSTYKKDIIIDIIGYRKYGHNEVDEPSVTQPLMYKKIRSQESLVKQYADRLIAEKLISEVEINDFEKYYRNLLENKKTVVNHLVEVAASQAFVDWEPYNKNDQRISVKTGVSLEALKRLARLQLDLPAGFQVQTIVQKLLNERLRMAEGQTPCDWGFVETLAYATLLNDGIGIRLSGQDVCRGTFFHRHAVLYDQKNGQEYVPLRQFAKNQHSFSVVNSLLSEEAVLAFEYGFSKTDPKTLVIWEAQYGDFANGAQVVIDQFISSGEEKWGMHSGLTLFLPHGYEGQGAEHSSARIERYLQLCAKQNMQVCIPSTPAQLFHLLRRQVLGLMRKPLIVMTPKSFLRNKLAVSSLEDLESGCFQPVLDDVKKYPVVKPMRIILCTGKIYYELFEKREAMQRGNIILLRIEQLYPFPDESLKALLLPYSMVKDILWCQEEPQNQGAWNSLKESIEACLLPDQTLGYVGREISAAPATGYLNLYRQQQDFIIQIALKEA